MNARIPQILALFALSLTATAADPSPAPSAASPTPEVNPVVDASKFKLVTPANPALPTLFLVGDSTMKSDAPKRGWADEVAPFFDPAKINVVNEAIGGRSSRTFQTEGRWDALLPMIKAGDFVVLQLGQNDPFPINDATRARGSIRDIGEETQEIDNLVTKKHEIVHTYGWYMRKYVSDVKAKGAVPILLSPTPLNRWVDGKVARSGTNSYAGWTEQVAQQTGTIYINDNEIIAEGLEQLGHDQAQPLFQDHIVHATPAGAQFNAKLGVSGFKAIQGDPLGKYLSPAGQAVPAFVAKQ